MRYIIVIGLTVIALVGCSNVVVNDYDESELSIDFGNEEAYKIGANPDGMPIFIDPEGALKQAKSDYKKGLQAIANEHDLTDLSHNNYQDYKTFGWQITDANEEVRKQGVKITKLLDIYENSF